MIGWKPAKLKNICTQISYGYTASATDENTGVKFLRITDIVKQSIDWDLVPFCNISESNYEKYKIENGDIVIARTGATVGYAKQIKPRSEKSVFASYLIRIKIDKGTDKYFIGLLIESITYKNYIKTIAGGAAQPNANAKDLTSFNFSLPPLTIQKKIAAVLSAYDDLIENNNRRIAILGKMAEEIYSEWFVRMRFPSHEKVKFHKGVPEGWEVKSIGDICLKITDGSHYSPKYYADGKPMASVKDMSNHGFSIENIKTISEQDFERLKKSDCMPMRNDVLIAKDGSYLKHVFVWNYDMEIVILSSIAILRPNKKMITPHFLALTLKQGATKSMMSGYVSGSALPRIILNDFAKMKLLVPSIRVLNEFENITNSIFVYINVLILKNSNLKKSRNLLLSRLLSGKLSVENLDIKFPPGIEETDA